jgi:carbonic anhydrase/acetyltransferase-like protein (isoleucine patch superfamily)
MIVEHEGKNPRIDDSVTICPGAIISGDVTIGQDTVVLEGAVIKSEGAPVTIGRNCIIMEKAVIRGAGRHPCKLENYILVGPHAHVSGAHVKSNCFIATGATLFNGSVIGEGSLIAVNSIVHIECHCPPATFLPMGYIAIGKPAEIHSPAESPTVHKKISEIGFTKTVFGFDSSNMTNGEAVRELCQKYARALKAHKNDRIIKDFQFSKTL